MKCWFFQGKPDRFEWRSRKDIAQALANAETSNIPFAEFTRVSEEWTAERLFKEMQVDDVAYFWSSGPQGGLEGWGHILDFAKSDGSGYRIPVSTELLLTKSISREEVSKGSAMSGHAFFTGGAACSGIVILAA